MTLGERIVEARKKRGISQKQLAEMIGISPTRLNYWEKDKRFPPIAEINKITAALNIDANYLVGQSEMEKPSAPEAGTEDLQETINSIFTRFLIEAGYIQSGGDISSQDADFLIHVIGIIEAWFNHSHQGE